MLEHVWHGVRGVADENHRCLGTKRLYTTGERLVRHVVLHDVDECFVGALLLSGELVERDNIPVADQADAAVEAALARRPKVEGGTGQLYMAPESASVFARAEADAKKAGDAFVTTERLLIAIADIDDVIWNLNTTPRKCLGYRTPIEAFAANLGVALEM